MNVVLYIHKSTAYFLTGLIGALFILGCANRYEEPELLALLAGGPTQTPSILVLGDSLTEYSRGFGLAELLAGRYRVFWKGAPNRDIPYWTQRLPEALSLETAQPLSAIVFPMGTNDAYLYEPARFQANIEEFHKNLRAYFAAHIYYTKMPRTKEPGLQNRILANNATLDGLVSNLDNAFVIDLDAIFEEHLLLFPLHSLYPATDPLHPNESGYHLIGKHIRETLLYSAKKTN